MNNKIQYILCVFVGEGTRTSPYTRIAFRLTRCSDGENLDVSTNVSSYASVLRSLKKLGIDSFTNLYYYVNNIKHKEYTEETKEYYFIGNPDMHEDEKLKTFVTPDAPDLNLE